MGSLVEKCGGRWWALEKKSFSKFNIPPQRSYARVSTNTFP